MMVPCISGELKVERTNLSDIGGGIKVARDDDVISHEMRS